MSPNPQTSVLSKQDFLALYDKHKNQVRSVVFKIAGGRDHEDLEQEVFIKVWQKYASFSGKSSLRTWIYRIAVNVALDFCRKKKRHHLQLLDGIEIEGQASSVNLETKDLILKGLNRLTPAHRAILTLQVWEGLSMTEISSVLSVPTGTAKSRLYHAKQALKEFLNSQGVEL